MELLLRLNRGGMTIIMVTHSHQCAQYARRILNMTDGRLFEKDLGIDVMTPVAEKRFACLN
jgi:putative ABC transport system ATP-binding protein